MRLADIQEKLLAGRIADYSEKLEALGQRATDYLPAELEKFKEATSYEEWLDFDPATVQEGIENPDKSHIDEMLPFAEKGNMPPQRQSMSRPRRILQNRPGLSTESRRK